MEMNGKEIVLVADRLLVAPDKGESTTKTGLYLPANAIDAKAVQAGRVVEVGPGLPMIRASEQSSESWKAESENSEETNYMPMQAKIGDLALYLKEEAIDITFEGKNYMIVPNHSVLALVRPSLVRSMDS